jgi:hypothetical protein
MRDRERAKRDRLEPTIGEGLRQENGPFELLAGAAVAAVVHVREPSNRQGIGSELVVLLHREDVGRERLRLGVAPSPEARSRPRDLPEPVRRPCGGLTHHGIEMEKSHRRVAPPVRDTSPADREADGLGRAAWGAHLGELGRRLGEAPHVEQALRAAEGLLTRRGRRDKRRTPQGSEREDLVHLGDGDERPIAQHAHPPPEHPRPPAAPLDEVRLEPVR